MNLTAPTFEINVPEHDLAYYISAFKGLRGEFGPQSGIVLFYLDDDLWTVRLHGINSREWLEYCANVYAELPSTVVDLVEEAAPYSEAAELGNSIPFEEVDDDGALEDVAAEEEAEEEYDDTEYGQEEDEEEGEEDTTNEDGETPSEEVQRKLRKAKIVRKTGSSAVTVETD